LELVDKQLMIKGTKEYKNNLVRATNVAYGLSSHRESVIETQEKVLERKGRQRWSRVATTIRISRVSRVRRVSRWVVGSVGLVAGLVGLAGLAGLKGGGNEAPSEVIEARY
jgi:hypothetical protein